MCRMNKPNRIWLTRAGIRIPAKSQQRLVHRQSFELPRIEQCIEEVCVDGGKVRLRTPLGEVCAWRDYKAIATNQATVANYQHNPQLIDWVNAQPLANPLTCLADGLSGGVEHRATDCDSRAAT